MDAVCDNSGFDYSTELEDAVLSTPRPSGKRKHPSQQQQQRDEHDDDIFVTPSSSRDDDDDKRDDVCFTPRKKRKTGAGTERAFSSSYSLLSPPPLLRKSTHRQRASYSAEFTDTDLAMLAFPSLRSCSSGEEDYPIRLSPRNALPPRRFSFGIPELAQPEERNGFFRVIGEDDRDCDDCSDDGSSFSWVEPPFLEMDDDCSEEGRRHKIILLPSLRARAPKLSLSVDLSLPSLAPEAFPDEGSAPPTPAAA